MKKIIILIAILFIFMGLKIDVYATSYSDQFYVSEDIDNLYYAKTKNGNTSYRQARFMRRSSDNKIIYCVEPFVNLAEHSDYKGYDYNYESLLKMSKATWKRISLLSYYGYGYKNHTDDKWYSITQIMIWKTIDKNADFYWTDTFKGQKVTKFTSEMAELDDLVKHHYDKPSFDDESYDMSISSSLTLTDKNNVLKNYEISNSNGLDVKINNDKLIINSDIKKGENISIDLVKRDKIYKSIPVVYVSDTYQNVLVVGSYENVDASLRVSINSGSIKIVKIDADNESTVPMGEASLIGAVYGVYDVDGKLVGEMTIGEDNSASLQELKYGKYKIREKSPGIGYQLDPNEYEITIDHENRDIELLLRNEVIEKKFRLHKYFDVSDDQKRVEKDIVFQIIDCNNNVYGEVKTDEYGEVEFDLPYGTYTIRQVNTTDGYAKVDDFVITVDESTPEVTEYYLNDLKVPDTYQYGVSKSIIIFLLSSFVTSIIGLKNVAKNS